ncbi:MAG: hypothetical protein KGD61_09595 [Candidatus Lokiarchaeota archaeon]|nr:hypothetical protein [Candidatus Lokiarchaeota archaeon]
MEQPDSYYDWEQNFKKKSKIKITEPKEGRILNSIDLPHDFFKHYLKLWKSENMKKEE